MDIPSLRIRAEQHVMLQVTVTVGCWFNVYHGLGHGWHDSILNEDSQFAETKVGYR